MALIVGKIKLKKKTAAAWTTQNPVLLDGELGYDSTNKKAVFGDNVTPWNSFPESAFFQAGQAATVGNNSITAVKIVDRNVTFIKLPEVQPGRLLGTSSGGVAKTIQELTLDPATMQISADGVVSSIGAAVANGDKGEISINSGVWVIDNNVITSPKLATTVITGLTAETAFADGDVMMFWDASANGGLGALRKLSKQSLVAALPTTGGSGSAVETVVTNEAGLDNLITLANGEGASDIHHAIISEEIALTANKTGSNAVPANVFVKSANGGRIVYGNFNIEHEGIGLLEPLSREPIYVINGTGRPSWTGDRCPTDVSLEIIDTGNESFSERLEIITDAFADHGVIIHALVPREFTNNAGVVLRGHHLINYPGVFTSSAETYTNNGSNHEAFVAMDDFSTIEWLPGAWWEESSVVNNFMFIEALHIKQSEVNRTGKNTKLKLINPCLRGHPNQRLKTLDAPNAIMMGNSDFQIEGGTLENLAGYNIGVGGNTHSGSGVSSGNYASGYIRGTTFKDLNTQILAIYNAEDLEISHCYFELGNSYNPYIRVFVDFEPNDGGETLRRIDMHHNRFNVKPFKTRLISASDVRTSAHGTVGLRNTINLPKHGMKTGHNVGFALKGSATSFTLNNGSATHPAYPNYGFGQVAFAVVIDEDTLKIANSLVNAVNGVTMTIPSAGSGEFYILDNRTIGSLLAVNSTDSSGIRDFNFSHNKIYAGHIDDPYAPFSSLTGLISGDGLEDAIFEHNRFENGYQIPIKFTRSRNIRFNYNHFARVNPSGTAPYPFLQLEAVGDSKFIGNTADKFSRNNSLAPYANYYGYFPVKETEMVSSAESDGTTTLIITDPIPGLSGVHMYDNILGIQIEFNNVTYTVTEYVRHPVVNSGVTPSRFEQTIKVNTTVPALAEKTVTGLSSNQLAFGSAHGFVANSWVRMYNTASATDSGNAGAYYNGTGLSNLLGYQVDVVDSTHIRLLDENGNIVPITALPASGTTKVRPAFRTKYAATMGNQFIDNEFPDGIQLASDSKSVIKLKQWDTPATLAVTGTNNNYNPASVNQQNYWAKNLWFTPTGATVLTGLRWQSFGRFNGDTYTLPTVHGEQRIIKNLGTASLTLAHNSSSSVDGYRFYTLNGADLKLSQGEETVVTYNKSRGTAGAWEVGLHPKLTTDYLSRVSTLRADIGNVSGTETDDWLNETNSGLSFYGSSGQAATTGSGTVVPVSVTEPPPNAVYNAQRIWYSFGSPASGTITIPRITEGAKTVRLHWRTLGTENPTLLTLEANGVDFTNVDFNPTTTNLRGHVQEFSGVEPTSGGEIVISFTYNEATEHIYFSAVEVY